ncbi:hypothetical protein OH492_07510 [Vibrio chagasii]|nr:hypothetical protein [Vibrio chagasii]
MLLHLHQHKRSLPFDENNTKTCMTVQNGSMSFRLTTTYSLSILSYLMIIWFETAFKWLIYSEGSSTLYRQKISARFNDAAFAAHLTSNYELDNSKVPSLLQQPNDSWRAL